MIALHFAAAVLFWYAAVAYTIGAGFRRSPRLAVRALVLAAFGMLNIAAMGMWA